MYCRKSYSTSYTASTKIYTFFQKRCQVASGKFSLVSVPSDLKYTPTHEWVRFENGVATIGITDHAQSELGDIVFVELPAAGRALQKGDSFASVESVKTVSDVYSPVAGEILESNAALGAQSELMNSQPYGLGWLIKVKTGDTGDDLLDGAAYEATF